MNNINSLFFAVDSTRSLFTKKNENYVDVSIPLPIGKVNSIITPSGFGNFTHFQRGRLLLAGGVVNKDFDIGTIIDNNKLISFSRRTNGDDTQNTLSLGVKSNNNRLMANGLLHRAYGKYMYNMTIYASPVANNHICLGFLTQNDCSTGRFGIIRQFSKNHDYDVAYDVTLSANTDIGITKKVELDTMLAGKFKLSDKASIIMGAKDKFKVGTDLNASLNPFCFVDLTIYGDKVSISGSNNEQTVSYTHQFDENASLTVGTNFKNSGPEIFFGIKF